MTQGRRVRRVVRRVDPWTVMRFSLLFYVCMLVVGMVTGLLLWGAASATGVIDNVERFIEELFSLDSFAFDGARLLVSSVIGGFLLVLLGTGTNVLMAVLYNLTADVVGGIEVTMLEEEPSRGPLV
ncbi:MAG TPA: DUF3566 domain-containing protein [Acidimicrobiales bacterium]|nr:DUF3566 domain-containing protein [Acidimicrobiales bacterium]